MNQPQILKLKQRILSIYLYYKDKDIYLSV